MDDNVKCPECGSESISLVGERYVAETRYQPAEYHTSASCNDCDWRGEYDDLEVKS